MSHLNFDFADFEAVSGVGGHFAGCCGSAAPFRAITVGVAVDHRHDLPCTRLPDHPGEHVAAHTDGRTLARWVDDQVRHA